MWLLWVRISSERIGWKVTAWQLVSSSVLLGAERLPGCLVCLRRGEGNHSCPVGYLQAVPSYYWVDAARLSLFSTTTVKDMKPWQFCKWFGHNICLLANDSEKGHCLLLAYYVEYIAVVFLILCTHFNDEMKACVAKERQYRSLSVQ